ncbi:MAG: phosphatase PAP2 family protein [Chlamydiales bacterium]|nr:phosphatase PAP2 family protein [Chlamydiales bacterium]NCF70347.1 phosphatase PAP2 family protein [Chlamydiales bacterium]
MTIKNFFLSILLSFSLITPHCAFPKKDFTKAGDILQVAIPVTGAAMTAYNQDLDGLWQLSRTMVINQVTVELMKRGINEERPNAGKHSFPSGHTAASFAGATFIHKRYGIEYGLPAYLLAGVVGASRLDSKAHWPQDVAFGAFLGFLIGHFSTSAFDKNESVTVSPIVGAKVAGLNFDVEF